MFRTLVKGGKGGLSPTGTPAEGARETDIQLNYEVGV